MIIHKGNIEEYLFDCFEGQLSQNQGDALMDFIHQNPEYEKDFVQWQKAYHHKDHKLETFGLAQRIKQIAPIQTGLKPQYIAGLLCLGIILGFVINGLSHWTSSEPDVVLTPLQLSQNDITLKTMEQVSTTGAKSITSYPSKAKTSMTQASNTEAPIAQDTPIHPDNTDPDSVSFQRDATPVLSSTVLESPLSAPKQPLVSDTATKKELKTEKTVSIKKKNKTKNKGIFSTTDKILPISGF